MSLSLMEHGIKPGALIDVFLLRSLGINSSFCFALFIREIDLYIGRFFCCSVRLSTSRTSQSHLRRQIGEGKVTTAEATLLLLQVELFPFLNTLFCDWHLFCSHDSQPPLWKFSTTSLIWSFVNSGAWRRSDRAWEVVEMLAIANWSSWSNHWASREPI